MFAAKRAASIFFLSVIVAVSVVIVLPWLMLAAVKVVITFP